MSEIQSNLFNYGEADPLIIREIRPVVRDGTTIGVIGPSNRDENCMISERLRYDHPTRNQHYYRKVGGYSYGRRALRLASQCGVTRLVIDEIDNNRVLEFDIHQYENGVETGVFKGDQNVCVPVEDAIHIWSREDCLILKKNGEAKERPNRYTQFDHPDLG